MVRYLGVRICYFYTPLKPHTPISMSHALRNLFVLLAAFFLQVNLFGQDGDSKVFFLGIGIEKCINGTPGKPNAVADVQLVKQRTTKDASSGDVNFTNNNSSLMISKAVSYTLFNDAATIKNIDSIITQIIKPLARPQDVFYIYISAQSTGLMGAFNVPADPIVPGKKTKAGAPQRIILEASHLKELCAELNCENQIIIADAVTWQENHGDVMSQLLLPPEKRINQIIVAPYTESTDSFLVAGKNVSAFAGAIFNAGQPMLRLLVKNTTVTTKVKTSLNNAFNALTSNDDPVAEVYESWKLIEGSVGAIAQVPQAKVEPKPVAKAEPAPVDPGRGFETDQPAPISPQYSLKDTKNFALIVANWTYTDADWPDLNNPLNDATALKSELETYYNFEVKLCTNLTKERMEAEMLALHKRSFSPNSQVLFYYAGHGGYQQLGANSGTGYLVPVDGKSQRVDSTMSSFYSYDILKARLLSLPSQHVLAMIDACYSGSADPSVFNKPSEGVTKDAMAQAGQGLKRASISDQMNECMLKKSRYFICSGKLEEVKDGMKGGLSPFARVITDRLADMRKKNLNDQEIIFGAELEISLSKTKDINSYSFPFGSSSESSCSFMFVPPAHWQK